MSGGVDSSVAAHLLTRAGHDVIGVFMRHGERVEVACAASDADSEGLGLPVLPSEPVRRDGKQGCCSASDAEDARRVADRLGVPFYALNLRDDFGRIIDYFVDEYSSGRTPNPCVVCNTWLKFGKLFDYADDVGAEFVATGHYAQIDRAGGASQLKRGVDLDKDQSYVLFGVAPELLSRMMLPIGGRKKSEIRAAAADLGLGVADKPDSQEICFVASGDHAEFIRQRGGATGAGEIVTTDGRVVGRHEGVEAFTVGQRKGLGVALGEPHYVVRIHVEERRVVLGKREELACRTLTAARANWLDSPPSQPFRCSAQIRYNHRGAAAHAEVLCDGRFRVEFDEPVYGVAPGQAAVLYDGDRVLGGGWIESPADEAPASPSPR